MINLPFGASGPWSIQSCELADNLESVVEDFQFRHTSHPTTASIPHQPKNRTTPAMVVSYCNIPKLEKMVCQSCSMLSGSPVVTNGRIIARASAM